MVSVNLLDTINEAVDIGLAKVGLPSTPHNRVEVLSGLYKRISDEGSTDISDRIILKTIEDEIVRLQDELL